VDLDKQSRGLFLDRHCRSEQPVVLAPHSLLHQQFDSVEIKIAPGASQNYQRSPVKLVVKALWCGVGTRVKTRKREKREKWTKWGDTHDLALYILSAYRITLGAILPSFWATPEGEKADR
jgi:hypothetical protein